MEEKKEMSYFDRQSEEFIDEAIRTIALTNENGIELLKNNLAIMLNGCFRKGIDAAWPWVLVNENDGTEKPFGTYCEVPTDMAEADVLEQFKEEYEVELGSLIETYLDLSDYDTFDEFEEAFHNEETDFDPIIIGLWNNLYLLNRYTGEEFHYDEGCDDHLSFLLQYVSDNWNDLK